MSGIIGCSVQRDGDNDGLVRELGGDERAGLFERIGVNGEKRLAVLDDGEGLAGSHLACSGVVGGGPSCPGSATSGRCSKTKFSLENSLSPPTVVYPTRSSRYL